MFIHGNKIMTLFMAVLLLFGSILLSLKIREKETELKLNNKKLEIVKNELENSNEKIINGNKI